jgi:hypothetical protein
MGDQKRSPKNGNTVHWLKQMLCTKLSCVGVVRNGLVIATWGGSGIKKTERFTTARLAVCVKNIHSSHSYQSDFLRTLGWKYSRMWAHTPQ